MIRSLRDKLGFESLEAVIAHIAKAYIESGGCKAGALNFTELMGRRNCMFEYDPRWSDIRVCCGVECFVISDITWCKMRRLFPELGLPEIRLPSGAEPC